MICFKNRGYRILTDSWYNQKCALEKEERLRIVKTAAAIIIGDIRYEIYDTTHYPPPENFLKMICLIAEILRFHQCRYLQQKTRRLKN